MNDNIPIRFLSYPEDLEYFNREFRGYMDHFDDLNNAFDKICLQVKTNTSDRRNAVINMLCRLCLRHFEGVLLLTMNGHSYSAVRLMRSLFEKCVDAYFIANDAQAFEDFWDFHLVGLEKEVGLQHVLELEPDYNSKKERFYVIVKGKKKLQFSWSTRNLVERAKSVGMDEHLIDNAYRLSNKFIHSSVHEVIASFIKEEDGTLSPATGSTEQERSLGKATLLLSTHLIRNVLRLLMSHFKLEEPKEFGLFFTAFDRNFEDEGEAM